MTQSNAEIVGAFVDETLNKGNMDAAAQFAWEDVVERVPLPGQGPGLEGLKDALCSMRAGFPDLVFTIAEQISEGEKRAKKFVPERHAVRSNIPNQENNL